MTFFLFKRVTLSTCETAGQTAEWIVKKRFWLLWVYIVDFLSSFSTYTFFGCLLFLAGGLLLSWLLLKSCSVGVSWVELANEIWELEYRFVFSSELGNFNVPLGFCWNIYLFIYVVYSYFFMHFFSVLFLLNCCAV